MADIQELKVESYAFEHHAAIPKKYTCDGEDVSPPLKISDMGDYVVSFAIIVDDPDAPLGDFVHWLVWNIPPKNASLEEGVKLENQGKNDFGKNRYNGPCPPKGKPHRYFFKIFALNAMLSLKEGSTKQELLNAMEGHIKAKGELVGTYER